MKLQMTHDALTTEDALLAMQDQLDPEEAKLNWRHCLVVVLQVTASLGACGIAHWMAT